MPANLGKAMKGASRAAPTQSAKGGKVDADMDAKLRAQAEADHRQRLIKATRQSLKEHLDREKRLAALARSKVEASWLRILRLAKLDELRRDVEVLAQQHEREVDRRDALLQMYERDLEESEEQHRASIRAHLRAIDGLLALQQERLADLDAGFQSELAEVEEEFAREREALAETFEAERREMKARLAAAEEMEEERAASARQAHEQTREALRNTAAERVEALARGCDEKIRSLERAFEREHRAYLRRTDTVAEKFKELTARDQRTQKELRERARHLRSLRSAVLSTRGKLLAVGRDYEAKNAKLLREREMVASHVVSLKERLARARGMARSKIADVGRMAGSAKHRVANAAQLGERILQLAERCRALETEHERVDPARDGVAVEGDHSRLGSDAEPSLAAGGEDPTKAAQERGWRPRTSTADSGIRARPTSTSVHESKAADAATDSAAAAALTEIMDGGELEALDRFHRRFNHASLQKLALEREQTALQQDNARLREALAQTLEGMSMTETTLQKPNPLLVVNGRTGAVRGPAARIGGLPVRVGIPPSGPAAIGAAPAIDAVQSVRANIAISRAQS